MPFFPKKKKKTCLNTYGFYQYHLHITTGGFLMLHFTVLKFMTCIFNNPEKQLVPLIECNKHMCSVLTVCIAVPGAMLPR